MPEFNAEQWKKDINNFLYERLPPDTTLREMEGLACNIFLSIEQMYHKSSPIDLPHPGAERREDEFTGRWA